MWTNREEFKERVTNHELKISVVGLGYVGLSISCLFVKHGFQVYGFDIAEEKIGRLEKGENYCPEEEWLTPIISDFAKLGIILSNDVPQASRVAEVIIIAVTTEAKDGRTSYDHIITATESIAKNLSPGKLLVYESTVEPGATDSILKPIFESSSGLKAGRDFGMVFSPERIDPGNKSRHIWNIPKIVGGIDPLSTELASFLYSQVIDKVVPVSNPSTAEIVKVMENTQRDVNIALTNLFAKMADKLRIDIEEALDAAATKWNFMRLKPGCGIGGECISDVAYMAINSMRQNELDSNLIIESRRINESMPHYTVDKLVNALRSARKDIKKVKIAILGLAYKGGTSDTRNSPALTIIDELKKLGVSQIVVYDPFIKNYDGLYCVSCQEDALNGCECAVIVTDHPQFKDLAFSQHTILIDGRNYLPRKAENYYGIGR